VRSCSLYNLTAPAQHRVDRQLQNLNRVEKFYLHHSAVGRTSTGVSTTNANDVGTTTNSTNLVHPIIPTIPSPPLREASDPPLAMKFQSLDFFLDIAAWEDQSLGVCCKFSGATDSGSVQETLP
jgi:hypothetical protein